MTELAVGDSVFISDTFADYEWAKGKVGVVVNIHELCWAAGCPAYQAGHTACTADKLADPTLAVVVDMVDTYGRPRKDVWHANIPREFLRPLTSESQSD